MHRCVAETSNERLCLATDSASPSAFLTSLFGSGSSSTTKNNHDGASVWGDARCPKTATSQPNDLWRFFSNANDDEDENDDVSEESPPPEQPSFFQELLRSDDVASCRVKEVMGVLELFESAVENWKPPPATRQWFPSVQQGLEIHTSVENQPPRQTGPLVKRSDDGGGNGLDRIPTWRVMSAAVYLSRASKEALLERCPAKLGRISGDHMSLMHSPDAESLLQLPLGRKVKLIAYGEKCGVVSQHVSLKAPKDLYTRKTHPHVTVSFAEKVLKRDIAAMKGNGTFEKWIFPLSLEGTVGIKMDNGRILFSEEEFYVETGVDLRAVKRELARERTNMVEDAVDQTPELEGDFQLEADAMEDGRPSEEIQRLAAHVSFSSNCEVTPSRPLMLSALPDQKHHELPHITYPTPTVTSSNEIYTGVPKIEEPSDVKVLRVSKCTPATFDRPGSPSKRCSTDQKQQENKKKQAELRVECEKHRQASREEQRKGEEYLEKARAAYRDGQRKMGDEFNKVSIEATLKHREHAKRAERLAYEASNLGRINVHTIDLHQLHLEEAIARLKKVVLGLSSLVEDVRTAYRLRIITGKGINSLDNVPVLRPAVLEFLKSSGLEAEIDELNEGVVIAFIDPPSS